MSEEQKRPDLDAIEARWNDPPPPWEGALVTIGARASGLYDYARADVPALLTYVRALEAERDALKEREREAGELLRELAPLAIFNPNLDDEAVCSGCGALTLGHEQMKHDGDCVVPRTWAWLAQGNE
ncbi:MAG: hypothetical protein WC657_06855 [Candidatus Paceibacterota bacterium]|jgi:hypothetical protein